MESIFKYGDHAITGISLMYIEPAKTYTFLMTLSIVGIYEQAARDLPKRAVSTGKY